MEALVLASIPLLLLKIDPINKSLMSDFVFVTTGKSITTYSL
ncbi:hypothetical protein SAMN05216480_10346 [Pustulibacterium marinum]|uniref:Uncharacterized protein n=1 Tax=Pustulibacterium marinum TaxID=1224947 RepID=A0A1I7G164_9FLAO|nr:hypothetical protein [Pustulibacterium marinum]SFU42137.1 hypothetical protein SAMN05216480_10346 [Pustulibacterium marinum]